MVTQRDRLLKLLKDQPVNSYQATYELGIKQAPTRIKELKELGYNIVSIKNRDRSVTWTLNKKPEKKTKWVIVNGFAREVVV